jgi:hypothetical protein
MQRLEVSGAVRPLKWPLGVKWLKKQNEVTFKESFEFKNVTSQQPPLKVSLTLTQCWG